MTGEKIDHDAPQPGGRAPAPGELATVQAFVNTHYDLAAGGGEVFEHPGALRDWLLSRGLLSRRTRLDADDLRRVLAVREGLRALAWANNDQELDAVALAHLQQASKGAGTEIHLGVDGPRFTAPAGGTIDDALGALLAITAGAMLDGTWPQFKACLGRDCGWAFYDRSRNQSARWCAMKICGDREKARAYYRRKTQAEES